MRAGRSLLLLGALSQGAAVATIFSALGKPGPLFLLVAGLLMVNLWVNSGRRLPEGSLQVGQGGAILCVGGGLGIWTLIAGFPSLWTLLVTVGLGLWLWSRMQSLLVNHPRQFRSQLLDEGKLDVILILLAVGFSAMYGEGADMKGKMLPLLLLFFWTRLYTLFLATRSMGSGKSSWARGAKESVPYLFVFGGLLLLLWSLSFFGPLWKLIAGGVRWGLMWIIYGIGVLIEPLPKWSGREEVGERTLPGTEQGDSSSYQIPVSEGGIAWEILSLLMFLFILAALILWFRRRRIHRSRSIDGSEITGEVRQFIRRDRRKSPHPPVVEAAPTWMRRQYRRFLSLMWKQGKVLHIGETPVEFARRVGEEEPNLGEVPGELTAYYMEERYGDLPVDSRRQRTTELLESLEER